MINVQSEYKNVSGVGLGLWGERKKGRGKRGKIAQRTEFLFGPRVPEECTEAEASGPDTDNPLFDLVVG
jgi:hypothetical protein